MYKGQLLQNKGINVMWIRELNIKNFGRFSNQVIRLEPGINVIYGENESGKTTLHSFVKGCMFGIKKMRGKASRTDVFHRYQPWENPAYYAGTIRFVCGEKVFRLERDFAKDAKSGRLICETDGEILSLEDGDLQMLLGNVGEAVFDNTVSIGQLRAETDEGLVVELQNHMANLEGSGSTSIRIEKALALLKEQKKQVEKRIEQIQSKERANIDLLLKQKAFLEAEADRSKALLQSALEQEERYKKEAAAESEERRSVFGRILDWMKRLFRRMFGRENSHCRKSLYETQGREERLSKLQGKIEQLESILQEKEVQIDNCIQEILMLKEKKPSEEILRLKKETASVDLAMERIREVINQMQSGVGQFLRRRTSEIFSEITKGRYCRVTVQDDLKLGVHTEDHYVSLEQLSKGTIWQLYFALRMAANEVLCRDESLPVILDDAFVMYDDGRLQQVLSWLVAQKKQVILLTCQRRERELLIQMGAAFTEVNLMR